jgi:integrase/recombinase XerD
MGDSLENAERYAELIMKRINSSKRIPQENKKATEAWVNFMKARGLSPKTIAKHVFCFEKFLDYLPKKVKLSKATREQIEAAVGKIEGSDYGAETKNNMRVVVKAFYKHYLGEDMYYPRQIAWIKTTFRKKKLIPEDILNEDEILRMVNAASNPRDKALVALLYDSGMRVGELLGMKIKSVSLEGELAHVTVNGKTGQRRIPILFSAPYLAAYLETLKDKKQDDSLWTARGTWSNMNWSLDESGVRKVLREIAKKAGIEKRIYPHLFRHSRATYYANRLTEQQLKLFFGWTGDSKMASTYVHMSGRDIDDAILQVHGKQPKEVIAPKLTEKICPRCRYANGIDFLHCQRCGAPLDVSLAMRETKVTGTMKEAMLEMIKDPEFQRDMLSYLQKRRKGKGD